MSQSQPTDILSSSAYNAELESLDYLIPSNEIPTLSGSQYTLDTIDAPSLRSEVSLRSNPLQYPPSLTQVGPNRKKAFLLYDTMVHSDFVEWWLQTDYGSRPQADKFGWDTHGRNDSIWSHFHQVAHSTDGAPKVMCKRCDRVLEHPYSLRLVGNGRPTYQGTSTMAKHLRTNACLQATAGKKTDISQFFKNRVCYTASKG